MFIVLSSCSLYPIMVTQSYNYNVWRKYTKKNVNNVLNQNVNVTKEQCWQPCYKYYGQFVLNAAV